MADHGQLFGCARCHGYDAEDSEAEAHRVAAEYFDNDLCWLMMDAQRHELALERHVGNSKAGSEGLVVVELWVVMLAQGGVLVLAVYARHMTGGCGNLAAPCGDWLRIRRFLDSCTEPAMTPELEVKSLDSYRPV